MKEFKSIQDLIVKAALYDEISTTISPAKLISGDVLQITFSKNNKYSTTHIDLGEKHRDPEEVGLYCCKKALFDLLEYPYEKITYQKEN